MANLGKVFEKDVESSFALVKDGWYTGVIESVDVKKTKEGTGSYMNIKYKTDEGRVVFGMITITNKNQTAEEIGEQQMTKLRAAIGIRRITDSDQLIGRRLMFKVGTRKGQDGYDDSNDVRDWKAVEGSQIPSFAAPAAPAAPAPAAPASTASPWASKLAAPAPETEGIF